MVMDRAQPVDYEPAMGWHVPLRPYMKGREASATIHVGAQQYDGTVVTLEPSRCALDGNADSVRIDGG